MACTKSSWNLVHPGFADLLDLIVLAMRCYTSTNELVYRSAEEISFKMRMDTLDFLGGRCYCYYKMFIQDLVNKILEMLEFGDRFRFAISATESFHKGVYITWNQSIAQIIRKQRINQSKLHNGCTYIPKESKSI